MEPARPVREVGLEQAVELEERLVVEADVVQVFRPEAPFPEAVFHRPGRELGIVLPAREPLFLGGGHDLSVDDQRRGRIVIIGRNTENIDHLGKYDTITGENGIP